MTSPTDTARYGHRTSLWLLNTTTGSQAYIDRVQNVEPALTFNTDAYYELGRKGKIGSTQAPPQYRIPFEQMMVNSLEAELILSGKALTATTYNLGDVLTNAGKIKAYVVSRNNSDVVVEEELYHGCSVSEMNFTATYGQALKQSFTLVGTSGSSLVAGQLVHDTWGALDNTSFGGINAKDMRIWFTSGSTATDRAYRLQSFTIRVAFPTTPVGEIGNRSLVGTLADAPDVTIEFDLLRADQQPMDKFFQVDGNGNYDFQNPTTPFNCFVRVFDPNNTEGGSVVKMFKIESVLVTSSTPIRAQVRGLSTMRYSLTMSKETTSDSGGLIISSLNDLT